VLQHKPQLIVVTGPNGAGKTSFIAENASKLQGYHIIKPDEIKDSWLHFSNAVKGRKNIVFETPFNDAAFKDKLDEAKNEGYQLTMYQLFLDSLSASLIRVQDRNPVAHYQLDKYQVKDNFNANFLNICSYYFYFDQAYFINNTRHDTKNKLYLAFNKMDIVYFRKNDNQYLKLFAEVSYKKNRMSDEAYRIIENNENYKISDFQKPALSRFLSS
jgi:predicted ABC-type ATPase